MKRIKKIFGFQCIALLLALTALIGLLPISSLQVHAENTLHITTPSEFLTFVLNSQSNSYAGWEISLETNITLTDEDIKAMKNTKIGRYTICGSSDVPFKGTFNGNGHTISGLKYDSTLAITHCTGLFGYTNGATIRNLIVDSADVQADRLGGILIGKADDTTIENVTVSNGILKVVCSDNVLTVITDGGIQSGALVGNATNCKFYNCESYNNNVYTNMTSGVQALGGKELCLGGIVGKSYGSIIEYCRAIGGQVSNRYDVAVNALGGNTLYVGGIAGSLQANGDTGSKAIDCFATNTLYFYCANYVSVGAGNAGHAGGIAGKLNGDDSLIQRCHYGGKSISSNQYNAVLVIPIPQKNTNISGIVDNFKGGKVEDSYFIDTAGPEKAVENEKNTSEYGPQSAETYKNQSFWTGHGYDFAGTTKRTSDYDNKGHYNKWVMDYNQGIPVHGKSVAAALDFEGAGTVTLATSELVESGVPKSEQVNGDVSTSDPYTFAVQAYKASEQSLTITATANDGYRVADWYKVSGVTATTLTEDYSYYEDIFSDTQKRMTGEENGITITKNADNSSIYKSESYNGEKTWVDNDLVVARYQAEVTFHELKIKGGGEINTDWYYYNDSLPDVKPKENAPTETATFIGWTTDVGGYEAITSAQLTALKKDGKFYEAGDAITKTMKLYPVYSDLISNIHVRFEGYNRDGLTGEENSNEDQTKRLYADGTVGETSASMKDGTVKISVTSEHEYNEKTNTTGFVSFNKNYTTTSDADPVTYRFIGWYEYDDDENSHLVSRETSYTLPDGVDLTEEHTYEARFEYRVDYYAKYTGTDVKDYHPYAEEKGGKKYTDVWHAYGEPFTSVQDISFWKKTLTWQTGGYDKEGTKIEEKTPVYAPFKAYSSVTDDNTTFRTVTVVSDFPGSGRYIAEEPKLNDFSETATPGDYYHFICWELDVYGDGNTLKYHKSSCKNPWDHGITIDQWYYFEAHVTADVIFHDYDNSKKTVQRRYQDTVMTDSYEYIYYYYDLINKKFSEEQLIDADTGTKYTFTGEASPSQTAPLSEVNTRKGYTFLGWIDKDSMSDYEKNYVFDGGDAYTTTSRSKAEPYLLDDKDIVEKAMPNIYAVYLKDYDYTFETNITEVPEGVNTPKDPWETKLESKDKGGATLTFEVDNGGTAVWKDTSKGTETYKLLKVGVTIDGKDAGTLTANDNGTYSYDLVTGKKYVFTAYYDPLIVTYHLNESSTELKIHNKGDTLGKSPLPTYGLADTIDKDTSEKYLFVGWTDEEPTDVGYHRLSSYSELDTKGISLVSSTTTVMKSMDLYPVYAPVAVAVNSNIDTVIENDTGAEKEKIRYLDRKTVDTLTLTATKYGDYEFVGWYKGYDVDNNTGGTKVTEDFTYDLSDTADLFGTAKTKSVAKTTYTAVYRKIAYTIVYHNTVGDAIYTVNVYDGDTRGFVTGETNVPIDTEAFTKIAEEMSGNETFQYWQLVTTDGTSTTTTDWETFKKTPVKDLCSGGVTTLNLYPVTETIKVYEGDIASENEMTSTGENSKVTIGSKSGEVAVYLNEDYGGDALTVQVQQKAYTSASTYKTSCPKPGEKVNLYPTATAETPCATQPTDTETGNAIFYFDKISFSKTVEGELGETSRAFAFTITAPGGKDSSVAGKSYKVTGVEGTTDIAFDTEGKATIGLKHGQTATIKYLPGDAEYTYTITEENCSTDGYKTTVKSSEKNETTEGPSESVKSSKNSVENPSTLAFTNDRSNYTPTGLSENAPAFIALLLTAAAALTGFYIVRIRRKRRRQ